MYDLTVSSIRVFNTSSFELVAETEAANCCVNSVTFHPYSAVLLGSSGERTFHIEGEIDAETDDSNYNWSELMVLKHSLLKASPVDSS